MKEGREITEERWVFLVIRVCEPELEGYRQVLRRGKKKGNHASNEVAVTALRKRGKREGFGNQNK